MRLRWQYVEDADRWFGRIDNTDDVYFIVIPEYESGSVAGHSELIYNLGDGEESTHEFIWCGEVPAKRRARVILNEWIKNGEI